LGYKRVFIRLNIDKDKIFNILEKISKNKNIINIYLAGGDNDIFRFFIFQTWRDYVIHQKLEGILQKYIDWYIYYKY